MDTITVEIDFGLGLSVICAAVAKRLRSLGWTEEQAERAEDRIANSIREKMPKTLELVSRDIALLGVSDGSSEYYQASAWASFALAGIEIADSLHAERN
jgi:hypothetical protein